MSERETPVAGAAAPPRAGDILIVDDTASNLQILSDMLKGEGYRTREALSGLAALRAAERRAPDLILLDIMMPEMDGYEVCRRLKTSAQLKDVPVIFLSALSETEDKVRALAAGGADYVTKPFQLDEVRARVETHLRLRRQQLEIESHNRRLQELVGEQVKEIADSQRKLALHLEQTLLGVIEWDTDFRAREWNPAAEAIFGYGREEAIGRPAAELILPDAILPEIESVWERLLQQKGGSFNTNENVTKDGRTIQCEWINTPLVDESGSVTGVMSLVRDVTERERAERELRQSEEKFSAAFHASPDLMSITRMSDGTILDVNEAYSQLLGYTRVESIGRSASELSLWADAADRATFIAAVAESGQIAEFETTLRRKDGGLLTCIDSARSIEFAGERCILSVVHDITERKLAEEERLVHLRLVEAMDRINRAIQGANDLEQMMRDVLDVVLASLECDRAWLFFPCDPDAPTFRVPMEVSRPEYPGAGASGADLPMSPDMAENLREALESDDPVTYLRGTDRPINKVSAEQFGVQSQMLVALHPKTGKPWVFGLHQCSHPRVWTAEETRLFREIARRLTDALTSLLAQRDMRESEAKYRRIVDTATEGIWLIGPDALTIFVNDKMAEMLGYPGEEMIGRPLTDFMFEEDTPDHVARTENRRRGLSENYERRLRRKDGETIWTQASAVPIFNDEHQLDGSMAMFTDITARKHAEEALRLSSERLRLATRAARIGIWDWDVEKNELVWDESMYRLYDIRQEDFGGAYDAWARAIHPEDRERTDGEIQAALRGEREYAPEFRIVLPDGSIRHIKADSQTFRDQDGKPLRMIGTNIDITERKQAEEALRQSEEQYRTLIQKIQAAVVVHGPDTQVLTSNSKAQELLGLTEGQMLGKLAIDTDWQFFSEDGTAVPPDDYPVSRVLATRQALRDLVLGVHRPGEAQEIGAWVLVNADPVFGEDEEIAQVIVTFVDISDRKQAEAAVQESEQRYRDIFDHSTDVLYLLEVTEDGRFRNVEVNPAFEASTGLSRDQVIGKCQEEVVGEETAAIVNEKYRCCAEAGVLMDEEAELQLPGGRRFYESSLIPLRDESGRVDRILGVSRDVSGRREAEIALRESEEKLRTIFDTMEEALTLNQLVTNDEGDVIDYRVLAVNPAFERESGLTREQAVSRSGIELYGLTTEYVTDFWRAHLGDVHAVKTDMYIEEIDAWKHVSTSIPVDGEFVISLSDITERKRAEEALRESEERFRRLAENARDVIYRMSIPDGGFEYISPAALQMFGHSPDEYYEDPALFREAIHLQWRAYFEEQWADLLRGEVPPTYEYQVIHSSGDVRWVNQRNILVRDGAGGPVALEGIVTDITERKAAENALREAAARLGEAQRMAHIGSWELEIPSDVLIWSDEIYRMFEIDPREFGASYEAFLGAIHPEDREAVDAAYTASLETRAPYAIDHRLLLSDGRIKYVHEECETTYDEAGKPIRSVGTVQDVTERKLAEQEILLLNAQLEQRVAERTRDLESANRELEAFSYSVSHDLRTPLRALDGFSQALLEDCGDALDETGAAYLARIRRAAQHMGELIDALLDLSRVARRELTPEEVDVSALARDITGQLEAAEPERHVEVVVADGLEVRADPALLEVVLGNLLGNAWKFTSKRAKARIEVGTVRADGEKAYFVRDNGAGFDPVYASTLFEPFHRLHDEAEFSGTGIGLATVQRVIGRHGGRCWAEGQEGKGATFYFTLPRAAEGGSRSVV